MCDSTEGIYTEKQLSIVASIKDEHLRDQLLHYIRLLDIMEKDRDSCLKRIEELEKKLEKLCDEELIDGTFIL